MLSGNLVEQNDVSRKRKSYSSQRTNSSSSLPSEASSSTLYSDCSSSSTVNRQQQVGNYSRSSSQTSLAGSSCHEEQLNDSFHRPDSSANSILLPEYSMESEAMFSAWAVSRQRNANFIQHMQKHALTFGLDSSSSTTSSSNSTTRTTENNGGPIEISHQGDMSHHQGPAFLSWKKLLLSKAKLKAASNTSALLAGFAMIAVVEIQLNSTIALPAPLLISFSICTTLLVAVHMLALLISTCILPNMEAVCNLHNLSLVHESPHEKMSKYIELAWICSTVLGILLFMIEVIILCWIQFYSLSKVAAYVATAILVPFILLFTWFAFIFYRNLVANTYETRKSQIEELKHVVLEMSDSMMLSNKSFH